MVAQEWVYFSPRMRVSLITYIFSRSNIFIESTASKEVNSSFSTVEEMLFTPFQQTLYKCHLSSRTEDPSFLTKHYLVSSRLHFRLLRAAQLLHFFSDLIFHFSKSAADSPRFLPCSLSHKLLNTCPGFLFQSFSALLFLPKQINTLSYFPGHSTLSSCSSISILIPSLSVLNLYLPTDSFLSVSSLNFFFSLKFYE